MPSPFSFSRPVMFFLASILLAHFSNAQQSSRKDLLLKSLSARPSTADIKEVTLSPGQVAPKHLHPCDVIGYVVSGSVNFQVEGEPMRTLQQGEAFFEPKDRTILHFDNASKEKPLTFIAIYLKEGKEENIRLLEK